MAKQDTQTKPASKELSFAAGLLRGLRNEEQSLDSRPSWPTSEAALRLAPPAVTNERVRVPVQDCVPNPYNPREFYPEPKIHELALTLKREGQIEAIKVTVLPDFPGKYVLIDGERRLRAFRHLGESFIDAEIRSDQDPVDLYALAYRANNDHERQTLFDDAVAWKRMLDANVFPNQASLAQRVGKDKAQVSKILSLNALPRSLLERMADASERVGLQAAYFIKLIFDKAGDEAAERALSGVIDGKKTNRDLERVVRELGENSRRQPGMRTRYGFRHDFEVGGQLIGQLKAFPDGRIQLALNGLANSDQEKLAKGIKEVVTAYTAAMSTSDRQPI